MSGLSPGDLVAHSCRMLEENPDAPLMDRAAWATVIASGGQVSDDKPTWGDIGAILGVPAYEALQGLLALREQAEARQ
jgi:hypothetical protein